MKIGFIGVGNMAGAIINGIIKNNIYDGKDLILYNPTISKSERFAQFGCVVAKNEEDVCTSSDVIFLCVKPQVFPSVLPKIAGGITDGKKIISIAAGVTVTSISDHLNNNATVIRVMPNTPLLIGKGVCAVAHDQSIPEKEYDIIFQIFSSIGLVCFVPEDRMNEVTAISGSGPAYIYYFIDAMATFGQRNGIDYETSLKLACATFKGAAEMIENTKSSPTELIKKVTSPGGTTIEAMKHFYEKDIAGIIDEAMAKCAKRGYELSV